MTDNPSDSQISKKDKNQSRFEFLESLQYEFVVAQLRHKIYKKPKDKEFWRRVMEGKKEKILSVSKRNGLPTIFDDKIISQNTYMQIYGMRGFPNFMYADEYQRRELRNKDFYNYYSTNSEFRLDFNSRSLIADLKSVNRKNQTAIVQIKKSDSQDEVGQEIKVSLDDIQRIL